MTRIRCQDKYEAQKLASMMYTEDGSKAQLNDIINIIGTECIVSHTDRSVHSITLYDEDEAGRFADFVQAIREGKFAIGTVRTADDTVDVSLD